MVDLGLLQRMYGDASMQATEKLQDGHAMALLAVYDYGYEEGMKRGRDETRRAIGAAAGKQLGLAMFEANDGSGYKFVGMGVLPPDASTS